MKLIKFLIICFCTLILTFNLFAEEVFEAPQILTSDLIRKQLVIEKTLVVTFVIIDQDNIRNIIINGVQQEFKTSDTVIITKKFRFKKGKTIIEVSAIDERGNKRTKSYMVGYGLLKNKPEKEEKSGPDSKFYYKILYGLNLEYDNNPTNDFSLPNYFGNISIDNNNIDISGVVKDSEQPDSKTTLKTILNMGYGSLNSIMGVVSSQYLKKTNAFLNSDVFFFGGGYRIGISKGHHIMFNYILNKINIGSYDFSLNHVVSTSYQFSSKSKDGASSKQLFSLEYTLKDFADPEKKEGSANTYKWDYSSLDKDKKDSFKNSITFGNSTEGSLESEVEYFTIDDDWKNKWPNGLKWDIGFGIGRRNFKNKDSTMAEMVLLKNSTRIDMPGRISSAIGWSFKNDIELVFNLKYSFNYSNVSPYERIIAGFIFNGSL